KFADFKRALVQKELSTNSQIKKLKTEAKASGSFQFKGNKLQFEFNSSLLDSINIAFDHLHEEDLSGVNKELENVKASLNKQNKVVRFRDKSSAGWAAVEEYESDELADDSEDEKKLRSAERRALSKIRLRYKIPFYFTPTSVFLPNNKSALHNADFVLGAITELLKVDSVVQCPCPPVVVNPLFVSIQPNGKGRLILDLRHVNFFVKKSKIKFEDAKSFLECLVASPCAWACSLAIIILRYLNLINNFW
ncbi:unnamed protein product, partial [Porites evermanni]